MLQGFTRNIKPLNILTDTEMQKIHEGALHVLERTGVNFLYGKALEMLKEHGCNTDFNTNRVRFPGQLVERCIEDTPFSFKMKARIPEHDLHIGDNRLYYLAGAGMQIVDIDTWEARPATQKELDDASVHLVVTSPPYCSTGM